MYQGGEYVIARAGYVLPRGDMLYQGGICYTKGENVKFSFCFTGFLTHIH